MEKVTAALSDSKKAEEKLEQQLEDQTREHNATEKKLAAIEETERG